MTSMSTNGVPLLVGALLACPLVLTPRVTHAQEAPAVIHACYIPTTGLIYRIKAEGLPDTCRAEDHVAFHWTVSVDASPAPGKPPTVRPSQGVEPVRAPNAMAEAAEAAPSAGIAVGTSTALADSRMFWDPAKAAFRAGWASGSQWDDGNVGQNSTAMGVNTLATGLRSTAFGVATQATADASTAMGYGGQATGFASTKMGYGGTASGIASTALGASAHATGDSAVAMGSNTTASGPGSTAMGSHTTAQGDYATAMGHKAFAAAHYSTAMGDESQASGQAATAMGTSAWAAGANSTAMGFRTTAQAYGSLVFGQYNLVSGNLTTWVDTDPLLVAGNGTSSSDRSNAMTLYKNGNLTVAGRMESESGGFVFPDGTVQYTAAESGVTARGLAAVSHDGVLLRGVNAVTAGRHNPWGWEEPPKGHYYVRFNFYPRYWAVTPGVDLTCGGVGVSVEQSGNSLTVLMGHNHDIDGDEVDVDCGFTIIVF